MVQTGKKWLDRLVTSTFTYKTVKMRKITSRSTCYKQPSTKTYLSANVKSETLLENLMLGSSLISYFPNLGANSVSGSLQQKIGKIEERVTKFYRTEAPPGAGAFSVQRLSQII